MKLVDYLRVAELINNCPKCDSEFVGNGKGTLNVGDNSLGRTCACGFKLQYEYDGKLNDEDLKTAINEALVEAVVIE